MDRINIFSRWSMSRSMNHMRSTQSSQSLTIDHAFVKNSTSSAILTLLDCQTLKIVTDHAYALLVTTSLESPVIVENKTQVFRYRIRRLQNPFQPNVIKHFNQAWNEVDSQLRKGRHAEVYDVDMLDKMLVEEMQEISRLVLGVLIPNDERQKLDKVVNELAEANDSSSTTRLFKRVQRSCATRNRMISENNQLTAIEEVCTKYRSVFNSNEKLLPLPQLQKPVMSSSMVQHLLSLVSERRVVNYLRKFPTTRSGGHDGIHIIQMKALIDTSFVSHLSLLFQACILHGTTPLRWNHAILYPLHKNPNLPYTASNTRPICITVMFRRMFESLILPVFQDSGFGFNRCDAAQGGFRRGYSTLTQASVLHHAISTQILPITVLLDLEAAYDKVRCDKLIIALESQKMPDLLIQLVCGLMYRSAVFSVAVNGDMSAPISRDLGLPQGTPLSPILFNKFVDTLVVDLNSILSTPRSSVLPSCLFFADDGVLMCRTWKDAARLLDACERWAIRQGMKFKVCKCGVLTTDTVQRSWHIPLTIHGSRIPIVSRYQYLGFPLTSSGIDFNVHRNNLINKAQRLMNFLSLYSDGWTPKVRLNMFKVRILFNF